MAPTKFVGYDFLESEAVVETFILGKKADELNVCRRSDSFLCRDGRSGWGSGIDVRRSMIGPKSASCDVSTRKIVRDGSDSSC